MCPKCPKCGSQEFLEVDKQMTYNSVSGFYRITECDECGFRLGITPADETKGVIAEKEKKEETKVNNDPETYTRPTEVKEEIEDIEEAIDLPD